MSETDETRFLQSAGGDDTASATVAASYQTFPRDNTEENHDFGSTVQLQPVVSSDNDENNEVGKRQTTNANRTTKGNILKTIAICLTFMNMVSYCLNCIVIF